MGNQLASSQQPDYNNLPDIGSALTFQERLGGGRFLKTLKCVNEDGILVVKVYFKRDPGLSLASYEEMLTEVRRRRRRTGTAPPLPPPPPPPLTLRRRRHPYRRAVPQVRAERAMHIPRLYTMHAGARQAHCQWRAQRHALPLVQGVAARSIPRAAVHA